MRQLPVFAGRGKPAIRWLATVILLLVACAPGPESVLLSADEATRTAAPPPPPVAITAPASAAESVGQTTAGDVLRLGVRRFAGLDPLTATDPGTEQVHALLYETLVTYDAAGNLVPLLADLPLASADGLSYAISLHAGITFHDGTPLDGPVAAAVLQNILNAPPDEVPWPLAVHEFRRMVASIESGPDTLTLRLREPYPALPALLAEQALALHHGAGTGTGPFIFAGQDEEAGTLSFETNPAYRDGPPLLAGVTVYAVGDDGGEAAATAALIDLLTSGQIDLAAHPESNHFDPQGAYEVVYGTERQTWLVFNQAAPPLDRPAIRLGINQGLDRAALVEALGLGGVAVPDATFTIDAIQARTAFANGGLPDGFDLAVWRLAENTVAAALDDALETVHVGTVSSAVNEAELLWGLTGDLNPLGGAEPRAGLQRSAPPEAFLLSTARDWARARWLALAGWPPEAMAALASDPPAAPLFSAPVVITQRAGVSGLGVTSGGWPRITAHSSK